MSNAAGGMQRRPNPAVIMGWTTTPGFHPAFHPTAAAAVGTPGFHPTAAAAVGTPGLRGPAIDRGPET